MSKSKAKDINFADYQYISPRKHKRNGGIEHLRGKLKYYQYRNDKSDHVPHERGLPRPERWRDMGLGGNYAEILKACQALQSKDVLAWTWVISPAPDLLILVPENERRELVRVLTEQTVTAYYEARGVDIPAYSYVLHERDTEDGAQQLHTHVILPGTVETLLGREPFYNNKRDGHVELFNQIADKQFELALDQAIGEHWRVLRPGLEVDPTQPLRPDLDNELDRWFGPRDAAPDFTVPPEVESDLDRWFARDLVADDSEVIMNWRSHLFGLVPYLFGLGAIVTVIGAVDLMLRLLGFHREIAFHLSLLIVLLGVYVGFQRWLRRSPKSVQKPDAGKEE